jgi:branched-chain amino acid transport system ATP-binding protein
MLLEGLELAKSFGGLTALRGVSFQLSPREVVGLIGPNGSGKTTLFNLISGVFPPDAGKVFLEREEITGLKPYQICRKGIGRTFQIVRPFLKMTCLENVLVGMVGTSGGNGPRQARQEQAMAELKFVGLSQWANRMAGDLTLIQKKQLEMARALATRPKVLLLDEVLAGLNPSEVLQALELIEEVRTRRGITVFWVEHVMGAIMKACDRVIVLDQGQKISEGSPEEVVSDPAVIRAYLGESDA